MPLADTNNNASSINRTSYTPWGEGSPSVDGTGYTGHVMDAGTGLTYMQQRYYDPQIGVFASVDPARVSTISARNFCRYCYAANNPYLFVDPDGRANAYGILAQRPADLSGEISKDEARAINRTQSGIDSTISGVEKNGTAEERANAKVWTVIVDVRLDKAPNGRGAASTETKRDPVTGETKSMVTTVSNQILKIGDSTAGPKVKFDGGLVTSPGKPAFAGLLGHEFGHGTQSNGRLPANSPENERDASGTAVRILNGASGVRRGEVEQP